MEANDQSITASVVSHGHGRLTEKIVDHLLACPEIGRVILTCNVPEPLNLPGDRRLLLVENRVARGFGANHNLAFARSSAPFFCVVNPDIQLGENPFSVLIAAVRNIGTGVCSPRVLGPGGAPEDHARDFPTLFSLVLKALGRDRSRHAERASGPFESPDWVAGMFLFFRSATFREIGGFDEGYHLYYEDVDLCVRLRRHGYDVVLCKDAAVFHEARRESRASPRFLRWHLFSMARYFRRHGGRLPKRTP